ncbi:MAG: GLUG motif-containing protein [Bacillota bacterium]
MLIILNSLVGQGTKDDPYIVETARDLLKIRHYPGAYFLQTQDLNMHDLNPENGQLPIANSNSDDSYFTGSYDGNGNKIYNLQLDMPARSDIGLFAILRNKSTIKNLHLVDVNINGRSFVGGITGCINQGAKIINCSVTGQISGSEIIGGIAGDNDGLIKNCKTDVTVEGNTDVGGLTGRNWYFGAMADSYTAKGVFRSQNNGAVLNSKSAGIIKGDKRVGGLVGFNYGLVNNCNSSATIPPGKYYIGQEIGDDLSKYHKN